MNENKRIRNDFHFEYSPPYPYRFKTWPSYIFYVRCRKRKGLNIPYVKCLPYAFYGDAFGLWVDVRACKQMPAN